jgi:hypothetical protein
MGLPADGLEGMTLGPTLEDGRRLLVLVSDNGFDNDTPTRLVVLGLRVRRVLDGVQVRQA